MQAFVLSSPRVLGGPTLPSLLHEWILFYSILEKESSLEDKTTYMPRNDKCGGTLMHAHKQASYHIIQPARVNDMIQRLSRKRDGPHGGGM